MEPQAAAEWTLWRTHSCVPRPDSSGRIARVAQSESVRHIAVEAKVIPAGSYRRALDCADKRCGLHWSRMRYCCAGAGPMAGRRKPKAHRCDGRPDQEIEELKP